jgi:Flp pilus assembly protein TadD
MRLAPVLPLLLLATGATAQPAPAAVQGPPAPPAASAAPGAYDPSLDPKRYDGCVRAIDADAAKVEQFAIEWQALGGGLPARHCLALAQLRQGKNAAAASTLSKAAQAAEAQKSPMAADLWNQAGNAAMLAGDMKGAVSHFSSGILAAGEFAPVRTANLLVDRARARTELADLAGARADLDQALKLTDKEPTAWLLSAALARRQGDLVRAGIDISRASALDSANPDVLFEQGNIAAANKDEVNARKLWEMAVKAESGSAAAEIAAKALAENKP